MVVHMAAGVSKNHDDTVISVSHPFRKLWATKRREDGGSGGGTATPAAAATAAAAAAAALQLQQQEREKSGCDPVEYKKV